MAVKKVRITIEADRHFISLLAANVALGELTKRDRLDPAQVLAVVVMAEMRGALPEQVHAMTPIEWRDHLEAIHEERKVTQE